MRLSKLTLREFAGHKLAESRVLYGQGNDASSKETHLLEADMEHRVVYVDGGAQFIPFEMVAVGDVDQYPETQHIEKLKREGVPVPTSEAAADILPKATGFGAWQPTDGGPVAKALEGRTICPKCRSSFPTDKAMWGHKRHCKGAKP